MTERWKIGDRIMDRWQIYRIFKGGMGTVYVVYDHEDRNVFAAKTFQDEVFARNPTVADRFTQEALTWVNLDSHQNVAAARFVRKIGGQPFLFLEYVSGGDLTSWIGTPRLTEDLPQVLRFAIQFCDGISHALSKGVSAHRDIKPANCLITENRTLKVTDFGLAKVFDDVVGVDSEMLRVPGLSMGLSRTGQGAGTPPYMAPEQFTNAKHVDVRADIYAFGVMLYEMLTGKLPFIGRTWAELERLHKSHIPPELSNQPSGLSALVGRCLAKEPGGRFADFAEVREELAGIYERLTGETAPQPVEGVELSAVQLTTKGASLDELGRREEAFACYEEAIRINPRFAGAWYNKGNWLDESGQNEEAISCYEVALEINPLYAEAWLNKGKALRHLEQHEEALTCYEQALEINPLYAEAWYNKGNALSRRGQQEEAVTCYGRAVEINPLLAEAWTNRGNELGGLGQTEEALDCLKRALEINPHLGAAWYNKGVIMGKLGQHAEAIDCYTHALEINPSDGRAWNNKGFALLESRELREALTCYEEAQRLGVSQAAQVISVLRQALRQLSE